MNKALERLLSFIESERYQGYSLYDSHNSPIPFKRLGKHLSFTINQVNKRSPVNFRPLLGVKKGINPKGFGLFLHSYSLLSNFSFFDRKEAEKKANYFFQWLVENPSKGYSGHCWGYNYHWPKKDGNDTPAYTPSVVVTGFVARALLAFHENFMAEKAKEILKSSSSFVINDIPIYKGEEGWCFSYTPMKKDIVVNANLLAAEVLAYTDFVNAENKYQEYIEQAVRFTLNNQNEDGSWFYSFNYDTREPKKQIDFHQGYVLESLLRLSQYSIIDLSAIKGSLLKGLDYYYNNQFDENGWAYWRYPSKYPVDIHNQSQGIITFSKFKDFNSNYLPFAKKIASWTKTNMQDPKGNFYYQKWPFITNRVNYMRWNQAWMLLALTTLLSSSEENE